MAGKIMNIFLHVAVETMSTVSLTYRIYRTLAKEGPWAVHLTLGLDWGIGRYSRYQYRSYTRKSAQVNYLLDLHNSNSSRSYYCDFSLIQARLPIESEGGRLSGRYFTECRYGSRIKWAWS